MRSQGSHFHRDHAGEARLRIGVALLGIGATFAIFLVTTFSGAMP